MAFMNRALKPTEEWYSADERELAAVASVACNGDIIWRAVQGGSQW